MIDIHLIYHIHSSEPFKNGYFFYRLPIDKNMKNLLNMPSIYIIYNYTQEYEEDRLSLNQVEKIVNELNDVVNRHQSEFIVNDKVQCYIHAYSF